MGISGPTGTCLDQPPAAALLPQRGDPPGVGTGGQPIHPWLKLSSMNARPPPLPPLTSQSQAAATGLGRGLDGVDGAMTPSAPCSTSDTASARRSPDQAGLAGRRVPAPPGGAMPQVPVFDPSPGRGASATPGAGFLQQTSAASQRGCRPAPGGGEARLAKKPGRGDSRPRCNSGAGPRRSSRAPPTGRHNHVAPAGDLGLVTGDQRPDPFQVGRLQPGQPVGPLAVGGAVAPARTSAARARTAPRTERASPAGGKGRSEAVGEGRPAGQTTGAIPGVPAGRREYPSVEAVAGVARQLRRRHLGEGPVEIGLGPVGAGRPASRRGSRRRGAQTARRQAAPPAAAPPAGARSAWRRLGWRAAGSPTGCAARPPANVPPGPAWWPGSPATATPAGHRRCSMSCQWRAGSLSGGTLPSIRRQPSADGQNAPASRPSPASRAPASAGLPEHRACRNRAPAGSGSLPKDGKATRRSTSPAVRPGGSEGVGPDRAGLFPRRQRSVGGLAQRVSTSFQAPAATATPSASGAESPWAPPRRRAPAGRDRRRWRAASGRCRAGRPGSRGAAACPAGDRRRGWHHGASGRPGRRSAPPRPRRPG